MEAAFVGGPAADGEGAIGHPEVVGADEAAVGAAHGGDRAAAVGRFQQAHIGPAAGGGEADAGLSVAAAGGGDGAHGGIERSKRRHRLGGVVAEVEGVGQEILAGVVLAHHRRVVVYQVVVARISAGAGIPDTARELMEGDGGELGEPGHILEAERIDVFEAGLVVDEAALEGGGHQPVGLSGAVGGEITQIH